MIKSAVKQIVLWLLIFSSLNSIAQITAGAYTMTRAKASALINPMKVKAGIKSYGYSSSVGGVAFGEVAQSLDGSKIELLSYNPARPDGERLEVKVIKNNTVYNVVLPVYDWEFIPTAIFANKDQDALITYFCHLTDLQYEEQLSEKECQIVNYHKVIDNTLIGLRLMQADLLAFHEIGAANFKENNVIIKGEGEQYFDEDANKIAITDVQNYYGSSGAQSYVICDVNQNIGFKLLQTSGVASLEFNGYPYWSCWKLDPKINPEDVFEDFFNTLSESEKRMISDGNLTKELTDKFLAYYNLKCQNNYKLLPVESEKLSLKMKEKKGGNPPVYNALCKFMRYSAFFRHCKKMNPVQYNAFVNKINNVQLAPIIETPTVICKGK
jgi:hypothetical protein